MNACSVGCPGGRHCAACPVSSTRPRPRNGPRPRDGLNQRSQRRLVFDQLYSCASADEIANPATGRCVQVDKTVGKALDTAARQLAMRTAAGFHPRAQQVILACPTRDTMYDPSTRNCVKDPARGAALRELSRLWNDARFANTGERANRNNLSNNATTNQPRPPLRTRPGPPPRTPPLYRRLPPPRAAAAALAAGWTAAPAPLPAQPPPLKPPSAAPALAAAHHQALPLPCFQG